MDEGIKLILFDLGNVLVDFDHSLAAKRISYFCNRSHQEIYELFFSSEITTLFEEGDISPLDFFAEVKKMLGLKLSYEAFVHIWNEVFFLSAKNRLVYSLVNNLRLRYQVAIISNINVLHYEYLKKHFPVFDVFNRVFLSCGMGLVKPNPLIYKRALEELKVSSGECFYTDDRQDLIESAKPLGIKAFVFKNPEKLKKDLLSSRVTIS